MKRNTKKIFHVTGTEEDNERSRLAKKEAKVLVAQSKQEALDNVYEDLDTKGGSKEDLQDYGNPNLGMVRDLDREEIKVALSQMKNGKATGPDEIPVEIFKCLGEFGEDMLWDLMKNMHRKE
ncbi:uncharacterized protein [Palaemon carinicauda]|uniref:uncharacterized protein n=1 Tax=Palaemon carinicauda TaxID=392227 RepID=UPI0035B66FBE